MEDIKKDIRYELRGKKLKIFFNEKLMLFVSDITTIHFVYSNNVSTNVWEIEIFHNQHLKTVLKLGTNERFLKLINILDTILY